jgi:hypothetical protein
MSAIKRKLRLSQRFIALATVLLLAGAAHADDEHGHHGDLEVGFVAGPEFNQLAFHGDLDEAALLEVIPPDSPLGIDGWIGEEPGFVALEAAEDGIEPLVDGAEVWLEIIDLDPALRIFDPVGFEYGVGESMLLGDADFHTHGFFVVDADAPAFDPDQEVWTGTYRFVDQGTTGYTASESFSISVEIPEPTSLALLVPALLGVIRRR